MQWFKNNWFGALIIACLVAFVVYQHWQVPDIKPEPSPSSRIFGRSFRTADYEGHKWVTYGDGVAHHPDCPCLQKRR